MNCVLQRGCKWRLWLQADDPQPVATPNSIYWSRRVREKLPLLPPREERAGARRIHLVRFEKCEQALDRPSPRPSPRSFLTGRGRRFAVHWQALTKYEFDQPPSLRAMEAGALPSIAGPSRDGGSLVTSAAPA